MSKKINIKRVFVWLVIIILTIFSFVFVFKKMSNNSIREVNEMIDNSTYTYKISYPIIGNKLIDNNIKNLISDKKKEIQDSLIEFTNEEFKYELIINYSINIYNNINYLKFNIYSFTGGNHYIRDDINFVYDKNKSLLILDDFFNSNYLDELSKLSYYYVMEYSNKNNLNFDDKWVKEGTEPIINNFSNYYLNKDGLNILFPPYQVSSWADGEVEIVIPYNKLINILKDKHKLVIDNTVDIPVFKEEDLSYLKDKKLIALTFDDGPSSLTNKLLDELKNKEAKVTFFVLGSRVNQYQETIKKAYEYGNQIASHTFSHFNLTKLSDYEVMKEINKTNDLIYDIIGISPMYIRPPYGSTNETIKQNNNMYTILWDIDTLDWKYKDKNKIYQTIIDNAKDGSIILLHDLYKSSIEGALNAIDTLQKEGYHFVTIDELIKVKEIVVNKEKTYFSFKKND